MLAPTIASHNPDEKKIDSMLRDSLQRILGATNAEVNKHERVFRAAQNKYAQAQTKEETLKAEEDMRLHAEVHDILEEDRMAINSRLSTVIQRQWQREEDERAFYAALNEYDE